MNKVYLSDHQGICSTDILVLKKVNNNVEPEFFIHILRSENFKNEVLLGIGGAQLPRVNWNYISSLLLPFPPLDVQKDIADELKVETEIINSNISLSERFEAKIAARIQSVWGAG